MDRESFDRRVFGVFNPLARSKSKSLRRSNKIRTFLFADDQIPKVRGFPNFVKVDSQEPRFAMRCTFNEEEPMLSLMSKQKCIAV